MVRADTNYLSERLPQDGLEISPEEHDGHLGIIYAIRVAEKQASSKVSVS